jgi:hypothetical protein
LNEKLNASALAVGAMATLAATTSKAERIALERETARAEARSAIANNGAVLRDKDFIFSSLEMMERGLRIPGRALRIP